MEERRASKAKTKAKMEVVEKDNKEQKLTYDQLNEACAQLYQQNQALTAQIKQMDLTNMFKRLDYLFLVLQHREAFKDTQFVENCAKEVQDALTIKEEEKEG